MKITRRDFLSIPPKCVAAALLGGAVGLSVGPGCSGSHSAGGNPPNILLLLADQLRIPPKGYGPNEGEYQGLKEIFGFAPLSAGNPFAEFFPGFLRLRKNAVVMKTHYTASAACTPSRSCIFTGQYTGGSEQTTGMFKNEEQVHWLDPDGTPTLGDWFRAVGYSTHYFGKWHVSNPGAPDYLEPWGFADYVSSLPEPHGSDAHNLGVYRDVGFAENVSDFLAKQAADESGRPWMAVGSLVNPHDVSSWPVNWHAPQARGVEPWVNFPPPPGVPAQGADSLPDANGLTVPLNPDDFPQDCAGLPPTRYENLDGKPLCQRDYSYKYGLAIGSKMKTTGLPTPYPFQLQGADADAWYTGYGQFYMYCHYLLDLQLRRIFEALDASGLAGNTIVLFVSDHGELGGAHGGMIQKWHQAYEEAIRVPMVVTSPLVNESATEMRFVTAPTSSIDIAPTLLGLAGFGKEALDIRKFRIEGHSPVRDFVGANLSSHIQGFAAGPVPGPDGKPRPGALFMTNDLITELAEDPDQATQNNYDQFMADVETAKNNGVPIVSGPVRQPNNVRALCAGDWKMVRYVDPEGVEDDEWELYCLAADPTEETNLVDFATGEVRDDAAVPGMTVEQVRLKSSQLKAELSRLEALMLQPA
ncbi:MAG: sulfatase-like hydrolase/transferase [Thermodesulfobacteriota bacterium]